jgi:voltage-gated potassium channel
MNPAPAPSVRRRVFDLLDQGARGRWARLVEAGVVALILVSTGACILESVPAWAERFAAAFGIIEIVTVAGFTIEHALRLWSAPEDALLQGRSDWRARLAWASRPQSLIDLFAIAPFYVALLTAADLRTLVIIRLIRFFKLARYSPGLASLADAIYAERRALVASGIILFGLVLIAASAMHFAEQDAQPDKLGTIPDAMYWAFITLATVGYGDVVPITPLGKMIASATAVIGIVMLALPVGILASAFADEIRQRDFVVTWTMVARVPIFAGLDAGELANITRFLRARSCQPGEHIVRRGEPAHSMYFIASGIVEVELPDSPVRLGGGDFFGEMALLQGTERSATVTAVTQARLLVLEAGDLKYLMDQTPAMRRQIRDVAETRRQDTPRQDDGAARDARDETQTS